MIIFVNGKIGGGSPAVGRPYFTEPPTPFVEQAEEFFNDGKTFFTEVDFNTFSTASKRLADGYEYARKSSGRITAGIGTDETFKFIAHSMGCAFAEGIARYFIEKGFNISAMLHINAFQSGKMTANPAIPITIDYQYTNDIVIRVPFLSDTRPISGAKIIRLKSDLWIRRRHRGPIYPRSTEFWDYCSVALRYCSAHSSN